jgi:beta-lactamase regulating signal transducer with metallopeptidase domain
MNLYLIILGKSALATSLFFLFYHFLLRRDTLFVRNRIYLIASIVLSIALPFIHIPILNPANIPVSDSFAYIVNANSGNKVLHPVLTENHSYSWMLLFLWVYISGMVLFLLKTFFAYYQVFRIIRKAVHTSLGHLNMVVTNKKVSPFSIFSWLVVSEETLQHPSFEKMVQHELIHSRQYHSVDLFIAEILIFLQWFNPFAWALRKSIVENLEYLVDKEVLALGVDAKDYQYSLLSFSMAGLKPAVANNFNINLLKKRIVMMNTNQTSKLRRFHTPMIVLCLISVSVLTVSFRKQDTNGIVRNNHSALSILSETRNLEALKSSNLGTPTSDQKRLTEETVLKTNSDGKLQKDETLFPSNTSDKDEAMISNEESLMKFIVEHIRYPKQGIDGNIEGTVNLLLKIGAQGIQVTVSREEIVSNVTVLKEVIVMGYANGNQPGRKSITPANQELFKIEAEQAVQSYSEIPQSLRDRTFLLPITFKLMDSPSTNGGAGKEITVTGFQTDNRSKDLEINKMILKIENRDATSPIKDPIYILNDEKIITKAEMEKINPDNILSLNVMKGKKIEHKTLGKLEGDMIFINLKK